jgi:peptidoglycan/xylan/chitin deacetylase (PgdA/CDA1 family)
VYKLSRFDRASLTALLLCGCGHTRGHDRMGTSPAPVGRIPTAPMVCEGAVPAGTLTFEKIAGWRDDAAAAYSIIHDDLCSPELRGIDRIAAPALEARGLVATMGAIAGDCQDYKLWAMVRGLESRGHEIANHSFTHERVRPHNATLEVAKSKQVLDRELQQPVRLFLFPYDVFQRSTIELVEAVGHRYARAGSRDDNDGLDNPPLNGKDPDNDLVLEFDAWPRSFSKYSLYPEKDILNVHVWNAIERGGFALRELHSVTPHAVAPVAGEGFFPVPRPIYDAHLDFLVNAWKANRLWTSTVSTIVRYRRARQACAASISAATITFDTSNPDCRTYTTPLSVILTSTEDVPGLQAIQGGASVFTRKLGPRRYSVTAYPTAGPVTVAGCRTPSPGVDPTVPLPRKPAPASSVCALESVRGAGGAGRMDDLERPPEQLQTLPNSAQRDRRDGTWSWYPPFTLGASIREEGRNRTLRYAAHDLGASAGVVLAFMGASGAGSCYDASAYKGVRFRIRGGAASDDPAARDKVVVSLVSAETQALKYGGDRGGGPGGHFHAHVPLTPDWKQVSLTWSQFAAPTWGETAGLTRPALTKLQAVDWGIPKEVSSFEINLDDIELF